MHWIAGGVVVLVVLLWGWSLLIIGARVQPSPGEAQPEGVSDASV
jgi:hypothetical protein